MYTIKSGQMKIRFSSAIFGWLTIKNVNDITKVPNHI